ncbi:MAG: FtsK/SpoIIIE domain-containing protein [Actinomycetota bacterium]
MEISLRIEDRRGDGPHHVGDVVARVEPGHRVGAVVDAVAGELGLLVDRECPVAKASTEGVGGDGADRVVALDRLATVVEAGLVSGDALVVGGRGPARHGAAVAGRPRLVVASGPDAGRSIELGWGVHVVGRDPATDLVLTDPQVSRRHLEVEVTPGDGLGEAIVTARVVAADRNQVRSGGAVVVDGATLRPEQVVRLGASTLVVRGDRLADTGRRAAAGGNPTRTDVFGQIPFHRTPYFPAPVRAAVVEPLGDIPAKPEGSRFAYLSALLPVLMGVSFAFVLGNPRYLLFAAFSPVMVIGNWFDQRRRSGKEFARAVERFEEELAAKAVEVERALADERDRRFAAAPDVAVLADRASARSGQLWVRDRSADDFLHLRVGVGDVPAALEVRHLDRGDADYRDRVVDAYGETDTVTDVPVRLPLGDLGVVGLVGRSSETSALMTSLVLQAACLHSPEDLVVVAATGPERRAGRWLCWLPHTRSTSSPLAGPHLAETTAGIDALVGELGAEAGRRLEGSTTRRFPRILAVLDRSLEPDAALVSRLLDAGPEVGITIVWLTDRAERVPRQASAVVDCRPAATGDLSRITSTDPEIADQLVDHERVSPELALATARALAPVRDASSANAVTAIPRVVPLFTALGVSSIDADTVARRWSVDRGHSLRGPIGHTESGPLLLDLVEHGPHGLIGGTSGAGKSELGMSLVAGLMAENPPTRVNFLFIDYKGGASSDVFRRAPHTVGYVTNLDGLLAMRALTSLRAELNRRMNLLQGRAKDLAEMIERHPDEAPPSLVIVVDEFATLVKEIPDFVAGMVDIAQRGRSLGIHLLLATQRPSGAVNDNIKANTNLRIALRMLDGGESTAVIGTPDAAAIPTPLRGRGYARLGAGELIAFQSAWSGAPLLAESGPPPVGVDRFGTTVALRDAARSAAVAGGATGATSPAARSDASGGAGATSGRTQLDALLDAVVEAGERLGLGRGRAPWLEVLPEVIALDEARVGLATGPGEPAPGTRVVLGMVDDPEAQAQYPAVVDLTRSGGLLIAGTGGSGKSTALITAAVSAALDDAEAGGGHLTIVGLDVASRELVGLARLPQCAAVATGDDLEAVTRIIDRLDRDFERRRTALAESVARSAAPPAETAVLLVIDGLDALIQTLEQGAGAAGLAPTLAALQRLITEGRQVGIHPLVATSRLSALRAAVTSAISGRLVLRQADAQGYGEAGIPAAQAKDLDLRPGQGFLDGSTLVQIASLTGPDPVGTTAAVASASDDASVATGSRARSAAEARRRRNRQALVDLAEHLPGRVDPRLATRPLPRRVTLPVVTGDRVGEVADPRRPIVAVADLTGDAYALDLRHANLSVVGDPRSGRSSVLAAIGRQAAAAGAEVWVVAPPGSPLGELREATRRCTNEGEERATALEELAELAAEPSDAPRLLLLDDHDLLPEHDRSVTGPLERLLGCPSLRWAAAGAKPRGFSASPIAQLVRAARSVVYLRPHDPREAHEVVGMPIPWHPGLPMTEGRGVAVVDRLAAIVQFADPFAEPDPRSPLEAASDGSALAAGVAGAAAPRPRPAARPRPPVIRSARLVAAPSRAVELAERPAASEVAVPT